MPVPRFLQTLSSGLASLTRAVFLLMLVFGHSWQPALGQAQEGRSFDELDVDPPMIRHEVLAEAPAAFRQQFRAEVTDDNALANVTLFWRFEGENAYNPVQMTPMPGSDVWSGRVPTSNLESRAIEYYLQARDVGGNRTVRGFAFSPLVRSIQGSEPAASETAAPPTVARSRVVYYVLGALAVGLIAGVVSSGDGGGSDDEPSECGTDGCEVLITFQSPVGQ